MACVAVFVDIEIVVIVAVVVLDCLVDVVVGDQGMGGTLSNFPQVCRTL